VCGVALSADPALLGDAEHAFEHFRKHWPRTAAIEANKKTLKEKYDLAKELYEKLRDVRIDIIKLQVRCDASVLLFLFAYCTEIEIATSGIVSFGFLFCSNAQLLFQSFTPQVMASRSTIGYLKKTIEALRRERALANEGLLGDDDHHRQGGNGSGDGYYGGADSAAAAAADGSSGGGDGVGASEEAEAMAKM